MLLRLRGFTPLILVEPPYTVWSPACAFQTTILDWKFVICSNRLLEKRHEV